LATRRFPDIIWDEAVPKLYSQKKGIPLDDAKIYLRQEYDKIGEERVEWYDIQYWFDRFELKNYNGLLDTYKNEISYYPETKSVLEELKKDYILIIISNAGRDFLKRTTEKIKHYFEYIYSAPSDFNLTKKSPDVFLKVCKQMKIKPSDFIHIGDNWIQDYIAPRKIGASAFFIDRDEKKTGKFVVKDLIDFKNKLSY
jgi:HAD superfamily hydrolase (TIGR01549 family)